LPGALGKVHVPWQQLREAGGSFIRNSWDFLRCRQQYFAGMRTLFGRFYEAIRHGGEPPIAYSEILRITRWMDEIFRQCPWDFPAEDEAPEKEHALITAGKE
jgi:hypothetical protein